jgi:signal transduction histidine kinase
MSKIHVDALKDRLEEVQSILGWMDLIIGSINDAVCVVNKNNEIVFSNNCFAELIGMPRVFLLGKNYHEVFKVTKTALPLTEYIANNRLSNSNNDEVNIYEWSDKENSKFIFRISSQALANDDQRVYLIQNITKEYELSRMKDDFINLASHQLRTPITAIMVYSHMLHDGYSGKLNARQAEISNTIVKSSERMIKLVDDLLNITRTQGKLNFASKDSVHLSEVFEKIHLELSPMLKSKKLNYSFNIPDDFPTLDIEVSVLHEIFSNLITNAVQYTRENGSIEVKVRRTKYKAKIYIRDTGIGIPRVYQSQLFERFSRAENAMKEFTEGTGLGLYMVKILLDKINGSISVDSKVNEGTTFCITLPIG